MPVKKTPNEMRLKRERHHFRNSPGRLYVKRAPWTMQSRNFYFGRRVGVIDSVDGPIDVRGVLFPFAVIARYADLDAMLADWIAL